MTRDRNYLFVWTTDDSHTFRDAKAFGADGTLTDEFNRTQMQWRVITSCHFGSRTVAAGCSRLGPLWLLGQAHQGVEYRMRGGVQPLCFHAGGILPS